MEDKEQLSLKLSIPPPEPRRVRLPDSREAITHKFKIKAGDVIYDEVNVDGRILYEKRFVDLNGYLTVGFYADGSPGEFFLTVGKAGDVWRVYDALMIAVSIGLQYGIPLEVFFEKFFLMKFEPGGMTETPDIPMITSIPDYLARWVFKRLLGKDFGQEGKDGHIGNSERAEK